MNRWLDLFVIREDKYICLVPLCIAVGILFFFACGGVSYILPLGFLAGAGALIVYGRRYSLLALPLGIAILCLALGYSAAAYQDWRVDAPVLKKELRYVTITGVVEGVEAAATSHGARVTITVQDIDKLQGDLPRAVRIKYNFAPPPEIGDVISVKANLQAPSGPVRPGSFDFNRYLHYKGINAVGYAVSRASTIEKAQTISTWWQGVRRKVTARILEQDATHTPIQVALITGERYAIDDNDYEAIRHSGLAHLLAISGLHIGMVAGFVFFLIRGGLAFVPSLALNWPIKKIAAVFALVAAFIYMALAGATIPSIRAFLMSGIVLIGVMFDRSAISVRLVALAASAVLLVYPASLLGPSFQLSFAAVTALILAYKALEDPLRYWRSGAGMMRRIAFYFVTLVLTTVIATLATAIFSLYHFNVIATYGVLANALAVPLMGFVVMPAGLTMLLLMPVGLDTWPADIMGYGIGWIVDIAHWTAAMEGAVFRWPQFNGWIVGLIVLAFFMALMGRAVYQTGALLLLLGAGFMFVKPQQPDILISDNFKLVGYYDGKNLYLSQTRSEKFTAEQWAQSLGVGAQNTLKFTDSKDIQCDTYGCTIGAEDVIWSKREESFDEDCTRARILLASYKAPHICYATNQLIDRIDVWRDGPQAVFIK